MRNFLIIFLVLMFINVSFSFSQCIVSQTSANTVTNWMMTSFAIGQSWTASCSGNLSRISLNVITPGNAPHTLMIYDNFNNLIYNQDIAPFTLSGVQPVYISGVCPLTQNNSYSFHFVGMDIFLELSYSDLDPYSFGDMMVVGAPVAGSDLYFEIETAPFHIPTLPQWGLLLMSAVFAGFGTRFIWKNNFF